MNNYDESSKNIWQKNSFILIFVFIACFLWGSAFPCIKIGYKIFNIDSDNLQGQILFAGLRFFLAGLLIIIINSFQNKSILIPHKENLLPILILSIFQTIGQYIFFYIGLAHTSGVNSSIINSSSTFFTILLACLIFKYEKISLKKIIACLLGFIGVLLIQIPDFNQDFKFNFLGDSFILISALCNAISSSFIKKFSSKHNPVLLSAYQFLLGGLVMIFIALLFNAKLSPNNLLSASLLLLYMACISAIAYTLWSLLLKHNPVSKISIFQFINPIIGVLLSALLLGENSQAFSYKGIISLLLVILGIIMIFYKKKKN